MGFQKTFQVIATRCLLRPKRILLSCTVAHSIGFKGKLVKAKLRLSMTLIPLHFTDYKAAPIEVAATASVHQSVHCLESPKQQVLKLEADRVILGQSLLCNVPGR